MAKLRAADRRRIGEELIREAQAEYLAEAFAGGDYTVASRHRDERNRVLWEFAYFNGPDPRADQQLSLLAGAVSDG
jgi:hypothetical protein